MAKVLVVYFSRTGVTGTAAQALARSLGAELDSIRPHRGYGGAGGYLSGILDSVHRRAPPADAGKDPAGYDLVVLGSPIWAGRLSGPARSYLKLHGGRLKTLACFCTSGSGGAYPKAFDEVASLGAPRPVATLSLGQGEVLSGAAQGKLDAFARSLPTGLRVVA